MNIPNLLTFARIGLVPLFLYLVFQPETSMKIWALAVFAFASLTDLLDGWSARKLNQESEFGKFLDPLADKFLVISTLIGLVFLDPLIPIWMVLVIFSRDMLITIMRWVAVRKGTSIRTSRFGKVKTAFQMISIVIITMVFIVRQNKVLVYRNESINNLNFPDIVHMTLAGGMDSILAVFPYWLMFLVTVLTAISGLRYLIYNWKVLLPPWKAVDEVHK